MTAIVRKASLFRNGRNQAVRIPKEFEMPGTEVVLTKEGNRLVLEPVQKETLLQILDRLEPIDEEWPEIKRSPPRPVEL